MYNTMVKLRNKKAFTLVEMMAVIAIVAVLVAVVVPIIGNSTTKARAATNAANLRSVEGQLSTARVSNPDLFLDAVDKLGAPWDTIMSSWENANQALGGYSWWNGIKEVLSVDKMEDLFEYNLCHFTADTNGTIVITGTGDNTYTLYNVPASVAVSAKGNPGMEVPKGTPMTIWITDNRAIATYETTSGAYVNADFALVAETGEFNGTPSGGLTKDDAEKSVICSFLGHNMSGCVCTRCGTVEHKASGYTHECDCGEITINEAHIDQKTYRSEKDGTCDYDDCAVTCGDADSGIAHIWGTDGKCSKCGTECTNHNNPPVNDNNKTTHHCSICNSKESHDWQTNSNLAEALTSVLTYLGLSAGVTTGKCDCGYEHDHGSYTNYDIAVMGSYHYCSVCGLLEQCNDGSNDGDHKCDKCGKDEISRCSDDNDDGLCDECGQSMPSDAC